MEEALGVLYNEDGLNEVESQDNSKMKITKLEEEGAYSVSNPNTMQIFISDLDNCLDYYNLCLKGEKVDGLVEGFVYQFYKDV